MGTAAVACRTTRIPAERLEPPQGCTEPGGVPFRSLPPDSQARLVVDATSGKFEIEGWWDEQRLAVRRSSGELVYGPLARIIPHDTLQRMTDSGFATGQWVLVARIQARGAYAKLKLGATTYDPDGRDRSTNSLWLCRQPSDGQWYARIIRPDNAVFYAIVTRRDHPQVPASLMPGAARWLWREQDEGVWMMCASGCCSATAFR
jgi:hypothetical protein